ncbi:chymotrypsin inhibitor-like [Venturia canescens]|uniref:chymotrypsin inhibitor-like n=1 Tax=Venturia canescens TaxID=32260 RepID=UPI001C9CA3C6|nr:chymotrypsin inhibitor-like [Venturia canescens]XP_043275439.1 chymotrypsin inhibitor-like [Venturia canescens]
MKNFVCIFALVAILACFEFADAGPAGQKCGPNESSTPCGPACENTCSMPDRKICPAICIIDGCTCNGGYVRDESTNKCVKLSRCGKE